MLVAGAAVWIELQSAVVTVLLPSDGAGAAHLIVPIPPNPALVGLQAFPQCLWPDPCAPGGVSASNALSITVQP